MALDMEKSVRTDSVPADQITYEISRTMHFLEVLVLLGIIESDEYAYDCKFALFNKFFMAHGAGAKC